MNEPPDRPTLAERGMASALSIDHWTAPESSKCRCEAAPELSVNFLPMHPRGGEQRSSTESAPPDKPSAARFQEIFVDYVGMMCSSLDAASRHVLDDRFDSFLGKGEREFKDAIMHLMQDGMTADARNTVAYKTLDSILQTKMGFKNTLFGLKRGDRYLREEPRSGRCFAEGSNLARCLEIFSGSASTKETTQVDENLNNSFEPLKEGQLRAPGHVFVCNASVCDLFCDAFLCPGAISKRKDAISGKIASRWWTSIMDNEKLKPHVLPYAFKRTRERVITHLNWPWEEFRQKRIAPVPLFVGGEVSLENSFAFASRLPLPSSEFHIEALMDTARQFIDAALEELRQNQLIPLARRERYLLAMPVIGTGGGFAGDLTGEIVESLLKLMSDRVSAESDLDLVLVCADEATYAHAQSIRLNLVEGRDDGASANVSRFPCFRWLTVEMRDQAEQLAQLASHGQLALFMGAGVSMGSGLPGWFDLLHTVEDMFTPTGEPNERKLGCATKWNPLEMADLLEGVCSSRCDRNGLKMTLKKRICDHIDEYGRHPGLLLSLLVSLPCQSIVTQNYDRLIESAFGCWSIRDSISNKELSVIPYHPRRAAKHWLLKMHGCTTACEEIVISGKDYAQYESSRYKTLCGLLQASLMTKHLLFVGFSLTDPNYAKIIEQVRNALRDDSSIAFLRQGSSRISTY